MTEQCTIDPMDTLRRAFAAASIGWLAALLLAPAAASRPPARQARVGYPLALLTYAAGSLVCHQRPERSFHLTGVQMPVCARCLGIYAGAALVAVAGLFRAPRAVQEASPSLGTVLILSALPAAATLVFEWTTGQAPGNWTRFVSGAPIGAAVAGIVRAVR
jgi:uncharacterized membrane protein